MKNQTCCFTGHRQLPPDMLSGISHKLKTEIYGLVDRGVTHFIAGGALGFDTLAALAVLECRKAIPELTLALYLPCPEPDRFWSADSRALYHLILRQTNMIRFLSDHYRPGCMHLRNRRMVEDSGFCICWQTQLKGGTAYTVDYAARCGLQIIRLAGQPPF